MSLELDMIFDMRLCLFFNGGITPEDVFGETPAISGEMAPV